MRLHILAPVFGADGQAAERIRVLNRWWNQQKHKLTVDYGFDEVSVNPIAPSLVLSIPGSVEVRFPQDPASLVGKGCAIRLELLAILADVDSVSPRERSNSFFVQIDGSGAFVYDSVYSILDKLSPRCPVVFGARDPLSNWGMAPGRKEIELFEIYLIEHRFDRRVREQLGVHHLPDSQAGVWGLHLTRLQDLSLSANDYAIEFDLMVSTLATDIKFDFAPVSLAPTRTASSFSAQSSISKLNFIMQKLRYTQQDIWALLEQYISAHRDDPSRVLPEKYCHAVRELGKSNRALNGIA
jgi:hypothetical protein